MLNQIINEQKTSDPGEILFQLDNKLVSIMRQQEVVDQGNSHTMDLALCRIDRKNQILTFSGAKRPIFFFKNGEFQQIKGSSSSIGELHYEDEKWFRVEDIKYSTGDSFYIFSDGFADQFGEQNSRKYMSARLKTFLQKIKNLPNRAPSTTRFRLRYSNGWAGRSKRMTYWSSALGFSGL
ncbi:MAG: SpoIIE family protein phosphatase [Cytophagales bacterium]|nr:SpoIIE family protein phosphatase [Cytophagales bacterium]